MTERARAGKRPGPALVLWSSAALFAVLFALLTYQLSASQPPSARPVLTRTVVKRRVVTTIVPAPGPNTVTASTTGAAESGATAPAAVTTGAS